MARLLCGKLKLWKPYLALATKSGNRWFSLRGALSHHHNASTKIITWLVRYVIGRTLTHYPIVGKHRKVFCSSTIETLDSLCNRRNPRKAVEILHHLENEGYSMDLSRLIKLGKLCGEPESLADAKVVHERISALVSASDITSRNVILRICSHCGSVDDALKLFDKIPEKDLDTWCVMMKCFVNNGYGKKAIDLFTRFKEEEIKPDGEMFKAVFSAYALTGDVNEGLLHFSAMQRDYGITPSMEHYHSVTKMLAISGHLEEALNFVERMPTEASVDVWETLMNLSRVHGDLELGDRCAELVQKLDATRLDEVSSAGLVVTKEASDFVEEFRRKDTLHLDKDTIYETLKSLKMQMREMGYVPDGTRRCECVEKENKEERIYGYKEEVAVVNRLLNSRPRSGVTVIHNVRIYPDCHNAMKFISVITGRNLVKRDSRRFHLFSNGVCICNDYW